MWPRDGQHRAIIRDSARRGEVQLLNLEIRFLELILEARIAILAVVINTPFAVAPDEVDLGRFVIDDRHDGGRERLFPLELLRLLAFAGAIVPVVRVDHVESLDNLLLDLGGFAAREDNGIGLHAVQLELVPYRLNLLEVFHHVEVPDLELGSARLVLVERVLGKRDKTEVLVESRVLSEERVDPDLPFKMLQLVLGLPAQPVPARFGRVKAFVVALGEVIDSAHDRQAQGNHDHHIEIEEGLLLDEDAKHPSGVHRETDNGHQGPGNEEPDGGFVPIVLDLVDYPANDDQQKPDDDEKAGRRLPGLRHFFALARHGDYLHFRLSTDRTVRNRQKTVALR